MADSISLEKSVQILSIAINENMPDLFDMILAKTHPIGPRLLNILMIKCMDANAMDMYTKVALRPESTLLEERLALKDEVLLF